MNDRRQAWQMQPDGTYIKVPWRDLDAADARVTGVHQNLMRLTTERLAASVQQGGIAAKSD
jgi:hypothetical protein